MGDDYAGPSVHLQIRAGACRPGRTEGPMYFNEGRVLTEECQIWTFGPDRTDTVRL
jgi:hypothetical protein